MAPIPKKRKTHCLSDLPVVLLVTKPGVHVHPKDLFKGDGDLRG